MCASRHVLPQDEGWDPSSRESSPVTHRCAGVQLKSRQLRGSSELVTDLVSNVYSPKASVNNPVTVPYETSGRGGSAAPLSSPFLMRVSSLLSPGTLESFPLLFLRCTCLTVCLGTHITVGGFQMTFSGSASGLLITGALTLS